MVGDASFQILYLNLIYEKNAIQLNTFPILKVKLFLKKKNLCSTTRLASLIGNSNDGFSICSVVRVSEHKN